MQQRDHVMVVVSLILAGSINQSINQCSYYLAYTCDQKPNRPSQFSPTLATNKKIMENREKPVE